MASTEVERHTGVDVEDVPSAEWGWSRRILGLTTSAACCLRVFLLLMMHGNHVGHVEDWFLIGFAALIVIAVARDWSLRRRGWIR